MKYRLLPYICSILLLLFASAGIPVYAQQQQQTQNVDKVKKASKKIESGIKKENSDTLAQGYYDLGETFYQQGELGKSESYYKKAKDLYEKKEDAEGIARSSRALAKVQEDLHKNYEAAGNYAVARDNNIKTGDINFNALNGNDFRRLNASDSLPVLESLIQKNLKWGLVNKDTGEIVSNYSRMGDVSLQNNKTSLAVDAYTNAYKFSQKIPEQAIRFNHLITDVYLQKKDFTSAIATKQELLNQDFVKNSSKVKANEITSLAGIYLLKKEDTTAIRLLNESYAISIRDGHTLEARSAVERLDSIFRATNRKDLSLRLYKDFLEKLPVIITRDSSIADNRLIAETETRIKELETEKKLKDDLIHRKNVFNYWLIGSVFLLILFAIATLYILNKLRIKNKKIALQSLRREMNPHFIFNSLNSINQFIANNNELEANRYLTKFSTLMRRVMENSKEDFVPLAKEIELLQTYLELEQTRFPDKFDFNFHIDDELLTDEQLCMPGMLVQPHLENAIWHGLRYSSQKGSLELRFVKKINGMEISVEDNGIGIAESKKHKTSNQQQHKGRGIANTIERVKILNELYNQHITCEVEDKMPPDTGVKVIMHVPLLKKSEA